MFRLAVLLGLIVAPVASAQVVIEEAFDQDPQWHGVNNVPPAEACRDIVQDFGWASAEVSGIASGGVGGRVARSFTPASYLKAIEPVTLADRLRASGSLVVRESHGGAAVLIGWLNAGSRGWRTPNSLVFRLDGEGGHFRVFFEYGTQHWLTGGGETFEGRYQENPKSLHPVGDTVHTWSYDYDPDGAEGQGAITFTLDGETYHAALAPGHKDDGAAFDRFGIMNVQIAGDAMEFYVGDLTIDGERQDLAADPQWLGLNNRATYTDCVQRPFHDVAWRDTARAGGAAGEIGGFVWRIDPANPDQALQYGVATGSINWAQPFEASGRICFASTAVDSGVLIGWYNAATAVGSPPPNFAGILMEGPSRIGHYFRPVVCGGNGAAAVCGEGPVIRPDGQSHQWTLAYTPEASGKAASIRVTLDEEAVEFAVPSEVIGGGVSTDRFGVVSWQQGGHFVEVYLDDLRVMTR